jgi:hypothetical protein
VLLPPLDAIQLECAEEANAEGDWYGLPLDLGVFESRVQPRPERLLAVEILLFECGARGGEAARGGIYARIAEGGRGKRRSCVDSREVAGAGVGHNYRIARTYLRSISW